MKKNIITLLIYVVFFHGLRFMNIKQKDKGKKGKEGVTVKRDRELTNKERMFRETLQRIEENLDTDTE